MQISLIEFSVENFKIFKEKATFSMLARKSAHTFESNGENLLKTTLIYGPNASGKSTLLQALDAMRYWITNSTKSEDGIVLPYTNFAFSDEVKDKPVFWEVVFSLGKEVYKYNFSLLKDRVFQENLFEILADGKEKKLISRTEDEINLFAEFKTSEDLKTITKTRKGTLFLSAANQWNNKLAGKIVKALGGNINVIQGTNSNNYMGFTIKMLKENIDAKEKILNFLKKADFCISEIDVTTIDIPDQVLTQIKALNISKNIPEKADTITFSHPRFNSNNEQSGFEKIDMRHESIGTQKFFHVLGPVIDTIEYGKVLLIDEFDNSLHPLLTKFIIDIFEKNNPNNAQLIVTTHDTSLLSYKLDFDKTQFWFTEKNEFGTAKLFSLAEFNMRNDTEFSKKYLEGRFGALPFIESNEK